MIRARRVHALAALLLLCHAAATAREGEPLTFSEAVARVRARNEALAAGRDEVDQRAAERAAARGLRSPKVTLELRETFINKPIEIDASPLPLAYRVQEDQFMKGQLRAAWPVYTGGRIDAANAAAAAAENEAGSRLSLTGDQLLTELARRYFGLCLARRAAGVAALKVEAMERHARRARRLMEEGVVAKVEELNAEVALANARAELASAGADAAIALEGLNNLMAGTEEVVPATPLFILRDVEDCAHFQDAVDGGHPALAVAAAKRDQARQGTRAEKGAALPSVYLFGVRELFPRDLTLLDPEWAAGVGAEYTLFDGGQGRNRIAAARAREELAADMTRKLRRDLRSLAAVRHREMGKALGQYDAFEATLALTEENLRVRVRAFEEGVATSVEVVDAVLSRDRALLGRLKAAHDFDTALFGLLEAAGLTRRHGDYLARAVPVPEQAAETPLPAAPPTEASPAQ